MNIQEIYQLGLAQGWDKEDAHYLATVAWAESKGKVDAKFSELNGTESYGIWQINSIHIPALIGAGILHSPEGGEIVEVFDEIDKTKWDALIAQLFDPAVNAKAAEFVGHHRDYPDVEAHLDDWDFDVWGTHKLEESNANHPSRYNFVPVGDPWRDPNGTQIDVIQAQIDAGLDESGGATLKPSEVSTGDPVLDSVKSNFPQLTPEQLSFAVEGIKAGDFNIAELEALFYTLNNPVTPEEIFEGDPILSEIMGAYASEFGYFGSFLEHTQVAPILLLASEENWLADKLNQELKRPDLHFAITIERLNALTEHGYDVSGMKEKVEAELASTDPTNPDRSWWGTTLDTERAWQMLLASDPAVAEKQKLDQINILRVAAGNLRINLSPERLETLAVDAITQGWDGADYGRNLLAEASWDEGKAAVGAIGANMNKINNLANDYMLTYSPGVVEDWARKIYLGEEDLNILEADFIQTAKEMYPTMAGKLDRGYNTRELFDPYAQKIANLLEMPATSIDFMNDPKYSPIIDSVTDTGERRAMTLSETAEYIRTSPLTKDLWGRTSQAKTAAQGFADFVARKFGGLG